MWNAPMLHGNIAPPMPAKRALAALDQPAPPIIGPPSRIPRDPPAPLDAATNMDGHFRPLFPVENHRIARLELSLHCSKKLMKNSREEWYGIVVSA
jgi:hypothetical protein